MLEDALNYMHDKWETPRRVKRWYVLSLPFAAVINVDLLLRREIADAVSPPGTLKGRSQKVKRVKMASQQSE